MVRSLMNMLFDELNDSITLNSTRLAVDKVKPCTGDGVGVVMQKKPSWY